jgi:hypothetical protein
MGYSHFEMVQDIEKHARNLDEWETEFIDSVSKQLGDGNSLTKKQADILKRIHEEKI